SPREIINTSTLFNLTILLIHILTDIPYTTLFRSAVRGLEAYDAAERGGDADTTTTIGSYRACAHPGGHGRTGTARGTTWGQRGVVGVAGDAGQRTVGDRLPCDFRRGGLAHEHHAVLAQPSCHGRILLPGLVRPDRFGATQ